MTTGPYRWIRHPYASLLLFMLGVALYRHAWPNYLGLVLELRCSARCTVKRRICIPVSRTIRTTSNAPTVCFPASTEPQSP